MLEPDEHRQVAVATQQVLDRLQRLRPTTRGWSACCPAHPDRTPSLSVAEGETGVLVKCWAGCTVEEIADAMDLRVADLFYHPVSGKKQPRRYRTGKPRTRRNDWRRQAAALEDEALTLWLHANAVFAFASNLDTTAWADDDWDVATDAICTALEAKVFSLRKTNLQKENIIGHPGTTVETTR